MKTKLLRKVRKEFKIEYWPNGIDNLFKCPVISLSCDIYMGTRYFVIMADGGQYRGDFIQACKTKQEAIQKAKNRVLSIVRGRYPKLGSYRKKFTKQQIWP